METVKIYLSNPHLFNGESFLETINGGHIIKSILQDGEKMAILTQRGRPGRSRQDLPKFQIFIGSTNASGITTLRQVGTIEEEELPQATKSLAWFFISKSVNPKVKEEKW